MADVRECDRCGQVAEGAHRLMIYKRPFPMPPEVAWEFFCRRCLRVMRIYAIVGFSLVGIVVAGLVAVTAWLVFRGP